MVETAAQDQAAKAEIEIRECTTVLEFDECIALQREAFALPDLEISPRRHLIVSRRAGGWTLGAFAAARMVGFVHHLVAVQNSDEIVGYSHMMAVAREFQNRGVGARLKWAQRRRALQEGRKFIKWTWDPMQARNAHFNLNRLGVIVNSLAENFYGTDYITVERESDHTNLDSDRLFADWHLDSERVVSLSEGRSPANTSAIAAAIEIPPNWTALIRDDIKRARREQLRVREEFKKAFNAGLVCAGFERDEARPRYLLFRES